MIFFADCTNRCFMYRNRFQKDLLRYVNFFHESSLGFTRFANLGVKFRRSYILFLLRFRK